jgi:hypothetical protein
MRFGNSVRVLRWWFGDLLFFVDHVRWDIDERRKQREKRLAREIARELRRPS